MERREFTRREFLYVSSVAAAGVVATACAPKPEATATAPPEAKATTVPTATKEAAPAATPTPSAAMGKEAPALAALVQAGELPPVEERLPVDVNVVPPLERIGEYGGTIRTVMEGDARYQIRSAYGPEGLLRPDWDNSTIVGNFCKSWELSEDGKTFTFQLWTGAKWSDGAPATADDIMFWWEDRMLNEELTPAAPGWLKPGGELMEVERVDDYTIRWKFAVAYPFVLLRLAHADGVYLINRGQKHYLMQFHPTYTPKEELDKKVQDAKLEHWYQLFNQQASISYGMPTETNADLPNLLPFKFKEREDPIRAYDRNPYYWKVDPEGNQLPYIDQVIVTTLENVEIADAMVTAGDVNFSVAFVLSLASYPLYREYEESGHYDVRLYKSCEATDTVFQPNQTCKDPVLREIFRDFRFRRALSHALDREEMNQVIHQGLGVPVQTHVVEASKYYTKEYEEAYIEYDPDLANELLDEMGLDERDADGYRLRSDGQPVAINHQFFPLSNSNTAASELAKEMWEAVGIKVNLINISSELVTERVEANEIEFGLHHADAATDLLWPVRPDWYVPVAVGWEKMWGIEWCRWYQSGGEEGEEPIEEIKRIQGIWDQMQRAVDPDEQLRLGKEILKSHADNLWTIGTVGHLPEPIIIGDNFINFPKEGEGYTGYDFLNTYPYHVEQTFFEGGKWTGEPG